MKEAVQKLKKGTQRAQSFSQRTQRVDNKGKSLCELCVFPACFRHSFSEGKPEQSEDIRGRLVSVVFQITFATTSFGLAPAARL